MSGHAAIATSVISLSVAAILVAFTFFGLQSLTAAHEQGTERVAACANAGGTWIEYAGDCVVPR